MPSSHPTPSSSSFTAASSTAAAAAAQNGQDGQAPAKPISWSRPRFATTAQCSPAQAPTGSATVATSVVTVVGSMARMDLGSCDITENGNSGENAPSYNTDTGLPTPPEKTEELNSSNLVPTIVVVPTLKTSTTTSTSTARNTSTKSNTTRPSTTVSRTVPMRRGVVVGGRKQMRRKRGAIIPSTAVAAATAAAQQAIAAATATTKAAEKVPTPPPSPKQLPDTVAPQSSQIPQTPPEQPCPQSLAQKKALLRRLHIRPAQEQEAMHINVERCALPPITSCKERALPGGMHCHFHSCKGTNQDMLDCRGLVYNPEETRFCATGYHTEAGEGMGDYLLQFMILGTQNAQLAEMSRREEQKRTLAWFEEKFGETINAPRGPPLDVAATRAKEPQNASRMPSLTPSAHVSPPSTSFSAPLPHQYVAFHRPKADWGSSSVDKWWEGNWSHRVSVPLELQVQADMYNYVRRPSSGSPPSEAFASTRPTSPVMAPRTLPAPVARDLMTESLIGGYQDRLSVSSRWQPTFGPQPRPPKLKRHQTS